MALRTASEHRRVRKRAWPALSLVGLLASATLLTATFQPLARLDVMSSGGFTAAYLELSKAFSEQTGVVLDTVYGASMGGAASAIPSRLQRNEAADVVILAGEALALLVGSGQVVADSRVDLASSRIGMAVRHGTAMPNIRTLEAFTQTLLQTESIAYSASASGTYLSTVLFPRLGIGEQTARKSIRVVGERVGTVVARGDADIGFQQVSELLPIEGITYVGPIPDEAQKITVFAAGVTTNAKDPNTAKRLIAFLSSPEAAPIIAKTGMAPQLRIPSR